MNKTKIKDIDSISISLEEKNIKVFIKYPKQSTLRKRVAMLEKLRKMLWEY